MYERRKARRVRMLKSGKLFLGKHAIPCLVRSLSDTGACLTVQSTVGIPAEFDFTLQDQATRSCKVIWRDQTKLRVHFE